MNFDRDRSGTVEGYELQQALVAFGYNLSPQALGVILRRYSTGGKVSFDGFVGLCVRIRSLTCKEQLQAETCACTERGGGLGWYIVIMSWYIVIMCTHTK